MVVREEEAEGVGAVAGVGTMAVIPPWIPSTSAWVRGSEVWDGKGEGSVIGCSSSIFVSRRNRLKAGEQRSVWVNKVVHRAWGVFVYKGGIYQVKKLY